MKILIYRYGSICEPDMIHAFTRSGLQVIEEKTEITNKRLTSSDRIELVEPILQEQHPLFVFSINFFPALAELCAIYNTFYLCWTVDAPVPELFSDAIRRPTNRIFLFDRAQYRMFAPYNPEHIYYLPLASCTERFDCVISEISDTERCKYSSEISFVGSLYHEKNPLSPILRELPSYAQGYINALVEASLHVYGYNPVPEAVTDELAAEIKRHDPGFYQMDKSIASTDRYVAAHSYIGMQIAETERIRTLNLLADHFPVDLYTRSDPAMLRNICVHNGAETLTEMPKIFHLSKINLNMTIKPIQTGLPLRIFDILGCGGFLMTNFQEELPEYFEIGAELESYSSPEELVDKCAYYLAHDDERRQIALNGYRKVCEQHTYMHRVKQMIAAITR